MENIYLLNAWEITEKVKNKELTATQVVEDYFKRIDKLDEKYGAFVSLHKEKALKKAKEIDSKIDSGVILGPLAGVPIALKDNILKEGEVASACSNILSNYKAVYNSTIVNKLEAADAIIIGNTNMDEFAMGSSTKTSAIKITRNPWDLTRVPGGSSGGAAAAVAGGLTPISLGSDTGGSIRQPASYCGIVGFKPTYGRVSRYGVIAFASSLDQVGPFGKSVRDVALTYETLAGGDDFDSTVSHREVEKVAHKLDNNIKGLRIGVPKEYLTDDLDPSISQITKDSIKKLADLGAEIKEISLPNTKYSVAVYYILAPAEASSNLARYDGIRLGKRALETDNLEKLYIKTRTEGFGEEVKRRIMIGSYVLSAGYYDAYFKKAQQVRRLVKNDFNKAFEEVDVILTPVSPSVAFPLEAKKSPVELYLEDIFTIPTSLAGLPALSIPAGLVDGLPVGIQLIGKAFDEKTLFNAGHAFEVTRGEFKLPVE